MLRLPHGALAAERLRAQDVVELLGEEQADERGGLVATPRLAAPALLLDLRVLEGEHRHFSLVGGCA